VGVFLSESFSNVVNARDWILDNSDVKHWKCTGKSGKILTFVVTFKVSVQQNLLKNLGPLSINYFSLQLMSGPTKLECLSLSGLSRLG
jgi:hypothetical protein